MSEQKFWVVLGTSLVVMLGLIYWVHTSRQVVEPPAGSSPEQVAALIREAVAPFEQQIAEQAARMEALVSVQQQMATALEDSGLRESLEQEIAQNAVETRDRLKADLEKYEARLDSLQAQADDPAVANEIAATRSEIQRIEVLLDDLSTRVDCAALASQQNVRTFVVPARTSLEVPGETIVISVGRLRNKAIDTVSINARASQDEPISTRVIGEVPIGGTVEFRHESMNYTAIFTHATRRFLNSALVGLELRSVPVELEECR